jgi:hypothetical protein
MSMSVSAALRIKVEMRANIFGPLPLFVATCAEPQIMVTGRSIDELRQNLDRVIAEVLTPELDENGELAARPVLLEFAA